jgi:hypothetical protein
MADSDTSGVVGGGGSRRGSGSTGGYTGGGSDTDAGSGVTGDDGSDTSYGGGGGSDDSDDSGGFGGSGGDDDDDSSGVVGGGGSRRGNDSDTTYSGGGSDTDAGSGVTGDDGDDTTFEGGPSDQNRTQAPSGDTGTADPRDTDEPSDRGTGTTTTPEGRTVTFDGDDNTVDVRRGETSERGTGITRGPEGVEVVRPAEEQPFTEERQPGREGERDRADQRGETAAAVTRYGQRQLDAQEREQFGDIDWSFGLGGPGDEVEQFTDETLPAAVEENITGPARDFIGEAEAASEPASRPVGVAGVGIVGQSNPGVLGAEFATDTTRAVDEFATAPGLVLEGIETAGFLVGDVGGAPDSESDGARAGEMEPAATTPGTNVLYVSPDRASLFSTAGTAAGVAAAESAAENPQDATRQLISGAALSAGTGAAIGRLGRFGIDRVRTAGATEVDLEEVTNPETAAFYRGSNVDTDARFPGADDPDLYQSDPAEAVRQQADDYTPSIIEDRFEAAGVEDGTDLKKAVETEPDGPGGGAGFETQEGSYESPGAFVGPELSPNFLGVGERGLSLRPGVPRLGGRPTAVIARTDVENPDADTLEQFNRELVDDRAGETTARTKPAGEANPGEIEAVIPPEAQFRAVDGVFSGGNRFGIGANYYTEVGGRRVPIRLVAPDDRVDVDARDVDADADAGRLASFSRPAGPDVDRPTPVGPYRRGSSSDTNESTSPQSSSILRSTGTPRSDGSRRASERRSDTPPSELSSIGPLGSRPVSDTRGDRGGSRGRRGSSSGSGGSSSTTGGSSSSGGSSGGGSSGGGSETSGMLFTFFGGGGSSSNRRDDDPQSQRESNDDVLFDTVADEDRYVANVQGVTDVLF